MRESFTALFAKNWGSLVMLLLLALLTWAVGSNAAQGYSWQWYRVWRFLGTWNEGVFSAGPLLTGLWMTVRLSAVSLLLALPLSLLVAGMRLSPSPAARLVAGVFLGAVRNTPLLMQLFVVYFVAAPVLGLSPFSAAALALAAFEGAYMAEVFRGGIASIPHNQWEAAYSLGLGLPLTLRLVILPQALRRVLPPLVSQIVSLIKDTSLVSAIAVADLTMRAQEIISETFLSFELWLLAAGLYLALTLAVSLPALWLERNYRW